MKRLYFVISFPGDTYTKLTRFLHRAAEGATSAFGLLHWRLPAYRPQRSLQRVRKKHVEAHGLPSEQPLPRSSSSATVFRAQLDELSVFCEAKGRGRRETSS